ncbi:hypothetical protein N473_07110 [Pseudoalteromonas luteoviolacea CPMOR-1]|uniref:Uncharacterized protein n=1 Tax=Pseudoalteromonas luteoviolacea CPMOR-1 TaxID=1365248 RepID=A0A167H4Y4_9GAMM|nr:hypothetical protein [Pseudoalteromonas luteoviolacea]KZN57638.1 hypothetical protein N473_07110 [Pseudoalteromonas luteoviolacea CPMOR-1]
MKDNNFLNQQADNLIAHFLKHSDCKTQQETIEATQIIINRAEVTQKDFGSDWQGSQASSPKAIN